MLAITGIWRLELGSNPPEFFPRGHHVRRGFEALLNHFGGNGFLFVLIEAGDGEDVCNPEFLSKVSDFQRFAGSVEPIAFATSAVDMVLKRMNRRMNGDDPEQERLPESRQLVAQYLEVYRWDAAETLSELVENADTPRHLIVDLFANVNDSARISVLIDELRLDLQSLFEQAGNGRATFGGEFATWSAQNRYIVRGKLASLVAAICLVGFICLLVLRDRGSAVAALIPTVFASVVVFGAMGFIGIRLDLASCVITSIVVGVGVDFSIHFLLRDREIRREQLAFLDASETSARVIRCAAPPILLDAISNVVAFSVFLLSPLIPVRNFGWLICMSMFACAVAAVVFLPDVRGARAEGDRGTASAG